MMNLHYALKKLNEARAERDTLIGVYNLIEKAGGVCCEKAEAFTAQKVNPAHDKVADAEKNLLAATPKTQGEALQKVAALMNEGMSHEDIAALRAEALSFTDPERDPIVPLCRRWLGLRKVWARMLSECPTGNYDGPDLLATEERLGDLEASILRLTPISAEGVAVLAEMQLVNEGPAELPGTDGWAEEMENPQFVVMRRLAHGARIVAGEAA